MYILKSFSSKQNRIIDIVDNYFHIRYFSIKEKLCPLSTKSNNGAVIHNVDLIYSNQMLYYVTLTVYYT